MIFLGALLLLDLEIGQGLGEAGDGGDLDTQRAPVHSGSCGALLRLCEAICDYADCLCELTPAWPSRALSQDDIKLSAAAFRPGRHFRLSRHRDPAVGVCHTVPVESSLLHCSGIDELSKEGTFCFRPALVNNSGSIRTIRFFRACVNYFRDIFRRRTIGRS